MKQIPNIIFIKTEYEKPFSYGGQLYANWGITRIDRLCEDFFRFIR